jgi:spore coat polysaccharide biosynthesis protein SpsF
VDTPEDFELMKKIFDSLHEKDSVFSLKDVVNLFREKPDLKEINRSVQQKEGDPIQIREK